jgi:hypothetical protein
MCALTAQDQFLIYSVKGNISVIENKVESKAKVGKLLQESTQIKLGPDAKLTLICNESNLITISKQGSFLLQDFKSQCETGQSNLSANYMRYVWTQLTQKPGTPEKNRKAFMKNVGAVSRSINSIWIDPRLDTMNYVKGNFPLSWKSFSEAEEYEFHLYDRNNTVPLTSITTKNKFINIADLRNHLKTGNSYYWSASVKGETNNEKKVLNIVARSEFDKLLHDMQQIDVTEGEAEKTFRVAFLLEQAHYLEEAYSHYQKAANLKPGLDLYKTTLDAFKKDYALTK